MRILAYFFKEVFVNFFGVLTILLLVFLSGRLVRHLASAASGQFPSDIIFSIMLYRLPGFLEILLPLAFFLGVMLAFGRFFVESEMIVLSACGVSKKRLISYVLIIAFPVYLFFNLVTHFLSPIGLKNYESLWDNPNNTMSFSTFVAGSFKSIGNNGLMIYAGNLDETKTEIKDVFVVMGKPDKQQGVDLIRAEKAQLVVDNNNNQYVELLSGNRVQSEDESLAYSITRFDKFAHIIDFDYYDNDSTKTIDSFSSLALLDQHQFESKIKLAWRLSLPLLILIVALIGFALSETNHRKGRYAKLLPGIIIYFVYYGFLSTGYNFTLEHKISPFMGIWLVHIIFLIVGLLFIYFQEVNQWLKGFYNARH